MGIENNDTNKDDSRFSMKIFDIDHDGKSDVFISKALYEYHGGFTQAYGYSDTRIKILLSDGETLRLKTSNVRNREADADEKTIFTGDFNGDGYIELANYGGNLISEGGTFTANRLNMYRTLSTSSNTGRIEKIKDGMGNETQVFYGYATASGIYSKTPVQNDGAINDIRTYSLPLSLVWKVNYPGNTSRPGTITYKYKDFKVHMKGGGPIGFEQVSSTHLLTGETIVTTIKKWDTEKLIPLETMVTNSIAGENSVTESIYSIEEVGHTYFAYEAASTLTDMYGNSAVSQNHYDTSKGVLLDMTIKNDGDEMYKKVSYSGYIKKSGVWLPGVMTMTQKHEHDPNPYSNRVQYQYNEKGDILQSIDRTGTDMALTTVSTYDDYGNCLSTERKGKSVICIKEYNDYDPTGRYVVKTYQNPEGAVNTYKYDSWGNLLEESDVTDSSNSLTTTHTYDNWGRRTSTTTPDGIVSSVTVGWGKTYGQHHYAFHQTSGKPWVLVWYNRSGRETLTKTFGPQNVLISKATSYDSNGHPTRIENTKGWFKQSEYISYDSFGRVVTDSISSGKVTTYSYGNRTVSSTIDGKTTTSVSDAWGNLLSSTDPAGGKVTYSYKSHGNPDKVTTHGSTIDMAYDAGGHKIYMKDPDAGVTTYSYSADGRLLKETDAKGIATTYEYDTLGRVSATKIGSETFRNSYVASGTGKLRLKRKTSVGGYIDYTYDNLGRVTKEIRNINGEGSYTINYSYDPYSRLKRVNYLGNILSVDYTYDEYGFRTDITANGKKVYHLKDYTGTTVTSTFTDSITYTRKIDAHGFDKTREIKCGSRTLDKLEMNFDPLTANLVSRTRYGFAMETFRYDNLDRLTQVLIDNDTESEMTYAPNGNILSKTGLGAYNYSSVNRPHAVMGVENLDSIIPSGTLLTTFNDSGMISSIEDEGNLIMEFKYGPDKHRSRSVLKIAGKQKRKTLYLNNVEFVLDGIVSRHFYFLEEDVIFINSPEGSRPYLAFKDHLGSILSVFDSSGKKVFDASYDAWGKQEVRTNTIGLQRGYCGHEMVNEFGIINMNGRLYDPVLGRFFSPDPFVQFHGNPQNYNRYSYCLNNPLKYTDPSGHFIGMAPILMGLFNLGQSMIMAHTNGQNIWKAAGINVLSSLASFGVGEVVQMAKMAPIGKELLRAGMHGVSSGLMSMLGGDNFLTGVVTGMSVSAIETLNKLAKFPDQGKVFASAAIGGVASLWMGSDFVSGALQGIRIASFNDSLHKGMDYESYGRRDDGSHEGVLKEFVCTYNPLLKWVNGFEVANTATTAVNLLGIAMEKYGSPTVVDFSKLPNFQNPSVTGSYTYKRTIDFKKFGPSVAKFGENANRVVAGGQIIIAFRQDWAELQETGKTNWYNTVRLGSQLIVSAYVWQIGFDLTASSLLWTGNPVIIGAGGVAGGTALTWGCGELTGKYIDYLYGK